MNELLSDIDIPFIFHRRRSPLSGDLRPIWKISLVLLMLLNSRGKKASLQKLHVLNYVCGSKETRNSFVRYVEGNAKKDEIIPRVEPSLNRALNIAKGEGLVEADGGKNIKLSPKGLELAKVLESSSDCLDAEKAFLKQIGAFVTEGRIEDLFNWRVLL